MGHDFPSDPVVKIVNGKTVQAEIRITFGDPYQQGIENGKSTWTYYLIKYRGSRTVRSKELHIVFDGNDVVVSYSFSTTEGTGENDVR